MGQKDRAVVNLNVEDQDPVTYMLAGEALADEVAHEEFPENLLGPKKRK